MIELYILLRNSAVFKSPYSAKEAGNYCIALKSAPNWRCIDYAPEVSTKLLKWVKQSSGGYRDIIDARLAFTLHYHGVTRFATANTKHFKNFKFEKVWNPMNSSGS